MRRFSEREGYKPIKDKIQIESIDSELRNRLWNALLKYYINRDVYNSDVDELYKMIWQDYFKKPIDQRGRNFPETYGRLRAYFFQCKWNEVYDFIEFIANTNIIRKYRVHNSVSVDNDFIYMCNTILETEVSGYRFVDNRIVKITSEIEIDEIEEALKRTDKISNINQHLSQALALLADRKEPDYRNSIKESVSAVEALCKTIAKNDKAKVGDALKIVKDKIGLHPALEKSFSALYGYTSSADGIRHALLEETTLNFEDAKFFLVSCSAFVNYLISKSDKLGLDLT